MAGQEEHATTTSTKLATYSMSQVTSLITGDLTLIWHKVRKERKTTSVHCVGAEALRLLTFQLEGTRS